MNIFDQHRHIIKAIRPILILQTACLMESLVDYVTDLNCDFLSLGWVYVVQKSSFATTLVWAGVAGFLAESQSLTPQGMMIVIYALIGGLLSMIRPSMMSSDQDIFFYVATPILVGLWISVFIWILNSHLWSGLFSVHSNPLSLHLGKLWGTLLIQSIITLLWVFIKTHRHRHTFGDPS